MLSICHSSAKIQSLITYILIYTYTYTNATNANIVSGNILMQITDHFPQFMVLKNTHVSHSKSESLKYDYSKFVEDAFLEDFNQIDFNYLENSDLDINRKFDRFLKRFKYSNK